MREIPMPWFAALVGGRPVGSEFRRLVRTFGLSSGDDPQSRLRWYENEAGVSVLVRERRVKAIQFFSAENPHFKGFPDALPLGVAFNMKRDDVHRVLGEPDDVVAARPEGVPPHGGIDKYHGERCTVVVGYSAQSGLIEVLGFSGRW